KDAAALFEKGAVAQWYKDNGWTYPVQGPSASGIGAVQQFFEALGLAKAPRVEINKQAIQLGGSVGERLQQTLEVKTHEKRPVFAHAVSNQPWVEVTTQASGTTARVNLVITVPDRPTETLQARVT